MPYFTVNLFDVGLIMPCCFPTNASVRGKRSLIVGVRHARPGGLVSWMLCTLRQVAKLLDAKARSNMFFLEYTVQKVDEDQPRHFLSAVSLGYNGR